MAGAMAIEVDFRQGGQEANALNEKSGERLRKVRFLPDFYLTGRKREAYYPARVVKSGREWSNLVANEPINRALFLNWPPTKFFFP
jgi:hypothetical protein